MDDPLHGSRIRHRLQAHPVLRPWECEPRRREGGARSPFPPFFFPDPESPLHTDRGPQLFLNRSGPPHSAPWSTGWRRGSPGKRIDTKRCLARAATLHGWGKGENAPGPALYSGRPNRKGTHMPHTSRNPGPGNAFHIPHRYSSSAPLARFLPRGRSVVATSVDSREAVPMVRPRRA